MCILIYQYFGPLALVLGFDVFVGGGSSSSVFVGRKRKLSYDFF